MSYFSNSKLSESQQISLTILQNVQNKLFPNEGTLPDISFLYF